MDINIAVGRSVNTKTWKNEVWTWDAFTAKIAEGHRTPETKKEYASATKAQQSKIKDVGGYVGGYLQDGVRRGDCLKYRQLVTLDVDFAPTNFWAIFCESFSVAAILHGTHTYSAERPRLRLVIPLNRRVTPNEYIALARKIADMLGIDFFDNTTFEPCRLMFWASTSKDAEYYFKEQKGVFLDADKILGMYTNYLDSSSWATPTLSIEKAHKTVSEQENPLEKKGIIGAFCRTYTISDAIYTFLSSKYAPSDLSDRYTYLDGSTSSGLVVYDDLYAFSHHGSDPCMGLLCNAFDLVRVHKFGHLDINGASTISTKRMSEFSAQDEYVKHTLATEIIANASYVFDTDTDTESLKWAAGLTLDPKGMYSSTAGNISLILAEDAKLKGRFRLNIFDGKEYACDSLPWRALAKSEPLKNVDYAGLRNYLERVYKIVAPSKIDDALALNIACNWFHPIQDFLRGLTWDGVKRLDTLLIDYFGVEDNIYTREAIVKSLCAAVSRVFIPGIKFDLVLTLTGDQGTGKSTFIRKLGKDWFSDTFSTVQGKESFEQLQGSWIIEMAELAGLRKAEVESIKHYISKSEDNYRPAYGRVIEQYKRQCIFIGTSNPIDFLRDPTGNRRFMPVDVNLDRAKKNVFSPEFDNEIDQIWAETYQRYLLGEPLYLSPEANKIAVREQRAHSETDERVGLIYSFLDLHLPKTWRDLDVHDRRNYIAQSKHEGVARDSVCVAEIWAECLLKEKAEMTRYNTKELNDILRSLPDWEQQKSPKDFPLYGKQKYYLRKLV